MTKKEILDAIKEYITTNGLQEITGQVMNVILTAIANIIPDETMLTSSFGGTVTPASNIVVTPGKQKWFFANPGTYSDYGNFTFNSENLNIISYNGLDWEKYEVLLPSNNAKKVFNKDDDTFPSTMKTTYKWLFGSVDNIELGGIKELKRADMNTSSDVNSTITYWMYSYFVPYTHSILTEFQINILNSGDLYIKRYKKSGTGSSATLTFQEQKVYTVVAGINTLNIRTLADKSGVINDFWTWDSDDIVALYCAGGMKYTTVSSPFNGLWGYGAAPGNNTQNFNVSQLSEVPNGGVLLSMKFIEIISSPVSGQVVSEIKSSNSALIPNVKAIIDYTTVNKPIELTQIVLIPSYGQSLSIGTDGGASTFASTTAVPEAYNISGVRNIVQDMNGGYVESFVEMAKQNNYSLPDNFKIMSCLGGEGGKSIIELSKGSVYYNNLITNIQTAKNTANSLNKSFSVPAFCWTQGEEDYRAGGNAASYGSGNYEAAKYAEKLIKLIDDLNTDIKAITGQKEDVKCIMYQTASHNPYGRYPRIAIEQLKATIIDKRILLAKTMYDVDYNAADYVHAPNKTYRNMGNLYGIGLFEAIVKKEHRLPIYPVKSNVVGPVIYIQFHVPVKPLIFDESWVSPLLDGKKGFNLVNISNEYTTSATVAASATTITNVELINADTVKITMSGAPAAGTRLTYGVNGLGWDIVNGNTSTGIRRSGRTEGARGNLRDSQTYFNPVSNYFNLYNWCPIFEIIF